MTQSTRPQEYDQGFARFYDRYFFVTPDVLIPRIETEGVIDIVKKLQEVDQTIVFCLDIGTGSGCVGITLALEIPTFNVTLSDISPEALGVAQKNAYRLGAKVNSTKGDLIIDKHYDLIVANLPYVPAERMRHLPSSVKDFEPHVALDGGRYGLEIIYRLIDKFLTTDARYLVLEIDDTHNLSHFQKYQSALQLKLEKDLFKRHRYLILRKK